MTTSLVPPRRRSSQLLLAVFVVLGAGFCVWLGEQVQWMRDRHAFLARQRELFVAADAGDLLPTKRPAEPPGALSLFGEQGVRDLHVLVVMPPGSSGVNHGQINLAKLLFPEASVREFVQQGTAVTASEEQNQTPPPSPR